MKPIVPKFTPSHASAPWRVRFRGRDYWFTKEAEARKKAAALNQQGTKAALTLREVDEYLHCKQLLGGSATVLTAVRYFLERNPQANPTLTVAQAVASHMARAKGRADYVEKKGYYMKMLTEELGDEKLVNVGPLSIQRMLDRHPSPWMVNNVLTHFRIFFRDCARLRLIQEDPTAGFAGQSTQATKVIMTVEDTAHLLEICATQFPEILSAVALQLFSGIRTREAMRLEWSAIRWGEIIDIGPAVSKTKERRVIDWWPEALTYWLPAPGSGPIMAHPKSYEVKKWMLVKACRATRPGFTFGQNAFRHTFCSMACAWFQNAGQAALLAGQRDINIFFRHYRDYRTKEEAQAYFTLRKAISQPL